MEKVKITSISNYEDVIVLEIKKEKSYYKFLYELFKQFNNEDLYYLKDDDIFKEKDVYTYYPGDNVNVVEIIGQEKIFFVIRTKQRDELIKYLKENSEFVKFKK